MVCRTNYPTCTFKSFTFSGEVRFNPINHLGGLLAGYEVGMVGVADPALAAVAHGHVELVLRVPLSPLLVQVIAHHLLHVIGRLVGHNTDGELA